MRQLAFDVIQGVDLPGWKDVKSADEIEISRTSGIESLFVLSHLGAMTNIIFKVVIKNKDCQSLLLRAYGNCMRRSNRDYVQAQTCSWTERRKSGISSSSATTTLAFLC